MMWVAALLLRVVLVNSLRACVCHRVLCFSICKDDEEDAAAEACDTSRCQTLITSLPQQVLPA